MRIVLSPVQRDSVLYAERMGETLVLNGVRFDLSGVGEGDTLPANAVGSDWIIEDITRTDGELVVILVLPFQGSPAPEVAFPGTLVDPHEGRLALPGSEDVEPVTHSGDGQIDWSKLITAEQKAAEQAAILLDAAKAIEDAWVATEMQLVASQLLMLEDDDPKALPGTARQWRDYRIQLRAWNADNPSFPDSTQRPLSPAA